MDAEPETAPLPAGWNAIANALDVGWGGEFDDYDAWGYYGFLKDFDPAHVLKAITNLGLSGRTFYPRPKVTDITAELRRLLGTDLPSHEFDAPSWAELYLPCERAAHRNREYKSLAVKQVREQFGEAAAAWFDVQGFEEILSTQMGGEWGRANREALGKRYAEFIAVQRERAARGLTVAAPGVRGGLRQINPLAALPVAS